MLFMIYEITGKILRKINSFKIYLVRITFLFFSHYTFSPQLCLHKFAEAEVGLMEKIRFVFVRFGSSISGG